MSPVQREQVLRVRTELDNIFVVRPGDKLVIAISRQLNMSEQADMVHFLGAHLPGVEAVIIDGVSGIAVYREAPE